MAGAKRGPTSGQRWRDDSRMEGRDDARAVVRRLAAAPLRPAARRRSGTTAAALDLPARTRAHLPVRVLLARLPDPVSYTHLRAHETPEHLVCRLLLEK